MASLDDNKCIICKREIDNKEKCSALLDGTLVVDYYGEDIETIFYENENEPPEALICEGCVPEHVRLLIHGRKLLLRAKLQGGGDVFLEEYGRYCFCPALGKGKAHSSGCDDLNNAIAKIEGRGSHEPSDT